MNIINIPFFAKDKEIIESVVSIRKKYLADFDIISSELSRQEQEYIENGITKIGQYISGVDIILEKRKEKVNELLTEKLKMIFEKKQNDLKSENIIENNFNILIEEIFPKIDYKYWMNLNPFYSDSLLLPTMKICLINYASKPGLINDVIENIENISCKTLVSLIENDIKNIVKNKLFQDKDKMLRVFDLINGWGGKMGKATYVKPKGRTTRNTSDTWFNHYVEGVQKAIKGDNEGLLNFKNIENVGDSFGTKHLYFWSLYGGSSPIPIYDNRIKTLLYFRKSNFPDFTQYVADMTNFASLKNISIHQLEKALFAFSTNYFPNEALSIKDDFTDTTDFEEASRLEELYNLDE